MHASIGCRQTKLFLSQCAKRSFGNAPVTYRSHRDQPLPHYTQVGVMELSERASTGYSVFVFIPRGAELCVETVW